MLPAGLDDRGWIAESADGLWIAGSLSGRFLALPANEIALAATPGLVVSVRVDTGGATSTVMIHDLSDGHLVMSLSRPGIVGTAVVSGATVYIAGDAPVGGPADAGVQAIALSDGSVRDVIVPGPGPADATGQLSRSQLRLSPSGRSLGSGLCMTDRCWIDIVDLGTGARTTPVLAQEGFLTALSEQTLYTVNETSTHLWARDAQSGSVLWSLDDGQIGRMYPISDGSSLVIARIPGPAGGGPFSFTLAVASAATGSLHTLLKEPVGLGRRLFPELSNDRFAVIGPDLLGSALAGTRAQVGLTLVDLLSGAVQPDAVTLTAP